MAVTVAKQADENPSRYFQVLQEQTAFKRFPMSKWLFSKFVLLGLLLAPAGAMAQAVVVTMRLDTNTISVGGSTTLRVFAQVAPNVRANAERIFSWYVDVLNTNGLVASANYGSMQKSASDNDPNLSSTGSN